MSPLELWQFLVPGYLFTVAIELPLLWFGLAGVHPPRRRLFAGWWLTACTYPIVVLVLPLAPGPSTATLGDSRGLYLLVAETFAPAAECALFYLAFDRGSAPRVWMRDMTAIVAANLASFGIGQLIWLFT